VGRRCVWDRGVMVVSYVADLFGAALGELNGSTGPDSSAVPQCAARRLRPPPPPAGVRFTAAHASHIAPHTIFQNPRIAPRLCPPPDPPVTEYTAVRLVKHGATPAFTVRG
jgi:hypothetical protein